MNFVCRFAAGRAALGLATVWSLAVATTATAAPPTELNRITTHHENVLGTFLELTVLTSQPDQGPLIEQTVLDEIERLRQIFSTYDAQSELSRWQQSHGAQTVSAELLEVMQLTDRWRSLSNGAFHPSTGAVAQLWKSASQTGREIDRNSLRQTVDQLRQPAWRLDPTQRSAERLSELPVDFNGIATGYIIDRAGQLALQTHPSLSGLLINIGGDLRAFGDLETDVHIARPDADAENSPPLASIRLRHRALTTSGSYRRGVVVQGVHHSHILDPRTGQPADAIASATVIATTATDADALATICCVLSPAESLSLIDQLPGTACLLVTADGQQLTSRDWVQVAPPAIRTVAAQQAQGADEGAGTSTGGDWSEQFELGVNFEVQRSGDARGYRRPYVAVWLEDADEFPVRTLALWLQTDGPGPRWHPDLRRWYRNDRVRKLVDGRELIGTVSAATRPAGKYKLVWDGHDDQGQPVAPGKYTLYLEVAREHGTYQLMQTEVEVGGAQPTDEKNLEGNVEIKGATVAYRRRMPKN